MPFGLAVHSTQGDWNLSFGVTVAAPVLGAGSVILNDTAPAGNANGCADPGDCLYVQLRIVNSGHGAARNLTGTLTCTDPNVQVVDADGECLTAPAGGEGLLSSFLVYILPACPTPSTLTFQVALAGPAGPLTELSYPVDSRRLGG